jgi:hypothetical protein
LMTGIVAAIISRLAVQRLSPLPGFCLPTISQSGL